MKGRLGFRIRFKQSAQVEIPDRLNRKLPTSLAAQTAYASLLIGVQRGPQTGRSNTFRKLESVVHSLQSSASGHVSVSPRRAGGRAPRYLDSNLPLFVAQVVQHNGP